MKCWSTTLLLATLGCGGAAGPNAVIPTAPVESAPLLSGRAKSACVYRAPEFTGGTALYLDANAENLFAHTSGTVEATFRIAPGRGLTRMTAELTHDGSDVAGWVSVTELSLAEAVPISDYAIAGNDYRLLISQARSGELDLGFRSDPAVQLVQPMAVTVPCSALTTEHVNFDAGAKAGLLKTPLAEGYYSGALSLYATPDGPVRAHLNFNEISVAVQARQPGFTRISFELGGLTYFGWVSTPEGSKLELEEWGTGYGYGRGGGRGGTAPNMPTCSRDLPLRVRLADGTEVIVGNVVAGTKLQLDGTEAVAGELHYSLDWISPAGNAAFVLTADEASHCTAP